MNFKVYNTAVQAAQRVPTPVNDNTLLFRCATESDAVSVGLRITAAIATHAALEPKVTVDRQNVRVEWLASASEALEEMLENVAGRARGLAYITRPLTPTEQRLVDQAARCLAALAERWDTDI